jgi:hypothetical protein
MVSPLELVWVRLSSFLTAAPGLPSSHAQVNFSAKRRELWEPRSVPAWFASDNRLGCLCVTLEPPGAFVAEEYAVELGFANVSDDAKVRGTWGKGV